MALLVLIYNSKTYINVCWFGYFFGSPPLVDIFSVQCLSPFYSKRDVFSSCCWKNETKQGLTVKVIKSRTAWNVILG